MKLVVTILIIGTALLAQAPSPVAFEVASVRLLPPNASDNAQGMRVDDAQFIANHESLATLIIWAYGVKWDRVVAPEWLETTYVDIQGKMPDRAKKDQAPLMLQRLLADRFKMSVHTEDREQSVYALVIGKNGLKMKEQEPTAQQDAPPAPGSTTVGLPGNEFNVSPNGTMSGQGLKMSRDRNGMHVEASKISAVIDFLSEMVERPVIDKTNLKGVYAIRLDISMEEMMQSDQAGDPETVFLNAVEKLGLKLEPQKGAVEMLVIDHIERTPTEN
jgi:uncharacterized protein (TIGR03435 family)